MANPRYPMHTLRPSAAQAHRTRRLVPLLLALLMTVTVIWPVQAQDQDTVNVLLAPGSHTLSVGETVDVEVVAREAGPFAGVNLELEFDERILEVVDMDPTQIGRQVLPGDFPYPDMVAKNIAQNEDGTIWYSAAHIGDRPKAQGSGTVMTIRFKARAAGTGLISFVAADFSDENGGMLVATATGGEIVVLPAAEATAPPTRTPAPTLAGGTVIPTVTPRNSATFSPGGQAATRTPLPTSTRSAGQMTPAPTQPGVYPDPGSSGVAPTEPSNAPMPTNPPADQYPGEAASPTRPGPPATALPGVQEPYPLAPEAEPTSPPPAQTAAETAQPSPSQPAAIVPAAQAGPAEAPGRETRLEPLIPEEMFICSSVLLILLTLALGIYLVRRRPVTP